LKKQSQILRLWHTANFWNVANNDGKNLDAATTTLLSFEPEPALAAKLKGLSGIIISDSKSLQINLPLVFENNLVNSSIMAQLPVKLVFYVNAINSELLLYTGLGISAKKVFAQANNISGNYLSQNLSFSAKTLGQANTISEADLSDTLSNFSLTGIEKLIGKSISTNTQSIDIKAISGANTFDLGNKIQQLAFVNFLKSKHFEQIPLAFRRQSDNSLLKDFPKLLILPENSPKNCIGIVIIPKASLVLTDTNQANYQNINHFMLHLPAIKYKLELSLATNGFENGSKFFYDTTEFNPTVANHPSMAGYKLLTLSQGNIDLFVEGKRLSIQKAQKRINMDIDPIKTLNISTKTSKISILKTV
jgi:hypothetical protein